MLFIVWLHFDSLKLFKFICKHVFLMCDKVSLLTLIDCFDLVCLLNSRFLMLSKQFICIFSLFIIVLFICIVACITNYMCFRSVCNQCFLKCWLFNWHNTVNDFLIIIFTPSVLLLKADFKLSCPEYVLIKFVWPDMLVLLTFSSIFMSPTIVYCFIEDHWAWFSSWSA